MFGVLTEHSFTFKRFKLLSYRFVINILNFSNALY